MNTLAKRLEKLSTQLLKHGDRLEGSAWNKSVTAFHKALSKFEDQFEDQVKNAKPGMRNLLKFFENPAHKILFKQPHLGKLYRSLTNKRFSPDTKPAAAKKAIIEHIKETGDPKSALSSAQALLAEINSSNQPVPREKEKLLLELQRLGGLGDEQLDYELATRFKKKADYEALAKAASLPVQKLEKPALINAIKQTARRLYSHQLQLT